LARFPGTRGDQLACLPPKAASGGLAEKDKRARPGGSTPGGNFWVGFDLYSPALGEYSYRLFEVAYPPEFFPITLTAADGAKTAESLGHFKSLLESVIRSPRTKQVIEAIMAQAAALGPSGAQDEG
jgi:hypothetical protein